jgi:hypothetical protein
MWKVYAGVFRFVFLVLHLLLIICVFDVVLYKGHFTQETESPWPVDFKHSCWWTRWRRSKFASHYACGTNGVCECKMDGKSTWIPPGIPTWHRQDRVSWSLGLFSRTASWRWAKRKTGRPWHVWGLAWIEIHWNNIWLRTLSTYDFKLHLRICDHTTWYWRCVGTAFGHFLLGSHNFIVMALDSCVKWPLAYMLWNINKILFGNWTSPH